MCFPCCVLKSHIPISGCQAQVPLNEYWAKTYVKLKTHTWLCPVNDRWRLEELQFIHDTLYCGSFTEGEALLSAIWKQGTTTKQPLENEMPLFLNIFPVKLQSKPFSRGLQNKVEILAGYPLNAELGSSQPITLTGWYVCRAEVMLVICH